ncbi:MAG: transcriptional regulator [Candidatus Bathyarchaeia archaeon]
MFHILLDGEAEQLEMAKHNDLEQRALQYIIRMGADGVLQSDLWRKLGASSREGSRIALKLESRGLIRREKELRDGRWTYRLFPKRLPASIDSIADCPCLMCPDASRCDPASTISPQTCERLTQWLISISKTEPTLLGDS